MKFRLTTAFIILTVIAVGFAFYPWREETQPEIVGVWHYPHKDVMVLGYSEKLLIRQNGTFSKQEQYRPYAETYNGRWHIDRDGVVVFNVDEVTKKTNGGVESRTLPLRAKFRCRCAIDPSGFLLIHENLNLISAEDCNLTWYSYSRLSPSEQDVEREKRMIADRLRIDEIRARKGLQDL